MRQAAVSVPYCVSQEMWLQLDKVQKVKTRQSWQTSGISVTGCYLQSVAGRGWKRPPTHRTAGAQPGLGHRAAGEGKVCPSLESNLLKETVHSVKLFTLIWKLVVALATLESHETHTHTVLISIHGHLHGWGVQTITWASHLAWLSQEMRFPLVYKDILKIAPIFQHLLYTSFMLPPLRSISLVATASLQGQQ